MHGSLYYNINKVKNSMIFKNHKKTLKSKKLLHTAHEKQNIFKVLIELNVV